MKSILKPILFFVALFFLIMAVAWMVAFVEASAPDIQGELGVLLYSSSGLSPKGYYLIFVGEMQEPIKVLDDSIVFKFDSQMEKPLAKIWSGRKAEIWFRDKDQLREYLR